MRKNKGIQNPWIKEVHLPPIPEPSTNPAKKKVSKKKRKRQEEETEERLRRLAENMMIMRTEPYDTTQLEPMVIISEKKYEKMQSDIQDLTAAIEALEGVIEEQRTNNRRLQGRLEEVMDKYRALTESYHQIQGW